MAGLDDVADALYSAPPSDFVARRDAAVKDARAAGDRELAREIGTLRKPTVSAWLVNELIRNDAHLAARLRELGDGLREAERSLDGPALRELSTQRRRFVASLVATAGRLAAQHGSRMTDSVGQEIDATLTAALADPRTAAEVTSGRLTGPREFAGFGSDPLGAESGGAQALDKVTSGRARLHAVPDLKEPPPQTEPDGASAAEQRRRARDREAEERAKAEQERAAEQERQRQELRRRKLEEADAAWREARDIVKQARKQADRAEQERRRLERELEEAQRELTVTNTALHRAESVLRKAEAKRDRLRGDS
jgi:DNA repair exonuclease SbcCD ATPase subunit